MERGPRIVFYGTPEFAVATLDALVRNGSDVVGVITAPDKASGRGLTLSQSAVKRYAVEHHLPVFQPERLKSPEFLHLLQALNPDIQVVVAFRMLPREVWNMPSLGTFNLHASLLPQYRGAAPINRAIMNGEKVTGVTTFFINEEIDTGAILMQESVGIGPDENAGELHDRLMTIGAGLVVKTVKGITGGTLAPTLQELIVPTDRLLQTAPKIHKEDTVIDWDQDCLSIYNRIRGLTPFPGVSTQIRLKDGSSLPVKIGSARIDRVTDSPVLDSGKVLTDGKRYLKIACRDGCMDILTIQPASKKMMNIIDFLNGMGALLS